MRATWLGAGTPGRLAPAGNTLIALGQEAALTDRPSLSDRPSVNGAPQQEALYLGALGEIGEGRGPTGFTL